ncbi:MAG TPA: T9SS type A sorting domain-containing protein, partial [Ignavibacteria bacterium]|nr:T9SS type A sorting domain-containing protein [Ignavibacteria bacterium]
DTTYTPYPPADSIRTGTDDEYPIFSRPVIGLSSEPESVFIAFQTLTKHWGGIPPDTANYKAIYITISYHNGSFEIPRQISPANPLRDWSYPSISPSNPAYNWYSLNSLVAAYCDSIPGTRVLTGTNNNHNASIYILNSTFYKMVGIKKLGDLIPASFILQQNYPNPFNPSTKIKFAVPNVHNESVSIKIYDALGKELETLVDKVISSGWYEVDFNGSKYPSGVYFYKLQCNNYTETKKMILVK